jgi:hypothetical protein
MLQRRNVPGAGVGTITPFKVILKDGFALTKCAKDYMYYRGDMYGDNWYDYKLGPVSNVTIVHYEDLIAKEDRVPMTQKVCFEFCRTVPHMGFFGIVNGRGCYCTPYFKPMESDSSQCDAVCEGDNTKMCGGKSKSSIFTMHMCASTEKDLGARQKKALALKTKMDTAIQYGYGVALMMQESGEVLQKEFGPVGDSAVTNLGQDEKVFAGKLEKQVGFANDAATELGFLSNTPALTDYDDPATVTLAERVMEAIDATIADSKTVFGELEQMGTLALPDDVKDASEQYYPMMYFVDKAYDKMPTTCGGELFTEPMVAGKDACAAACDDHIHDCVGFQWFRCGETKIGTCHLFRGFKTATSYTKCGGKAASFLQIVGKKVVPFSASCFAKLSKFEGTTLAPDPSGKCKSCLKSITQADRCYYSEGTCKNAVTTPPPTTPPPSTPPPPTPPPTPPPPTPPPTPAPETTTTTTTTPPTTPPGIVETTTTMTTTRTTGSRRRQPIRPPPTPAPPQPPSPGPQDDWCPDDCGKVDCDLRIMNALTGLCIHCTESVCRNYPSWSVTIENDDEACTKCRYCIEKNKDTAKHQKCKAYWK